MPVTDQTIQMKARLRAAQSLQMKAKIVGFKSSALEVDFDILVNLHQRLTVYYNIGDKARSFRTIQLKANIVRPLQARLTIEYAVCWTGPALPVVRPTQRTNARTLQTILMRARIKSH